VENARHKNADGRKMRERKCGTVSQGVENAGQENERKAEYGKPSVAKYQNPHNNVFEIFDD